MEHKEIFEEFVKCKIRGMMFHSNMADYYTYLQCCIFKNKHEKEYKCECKSLRCIKDYFIEIYKMPLIVNHSNLQVDDFTSSSWGEYNFTKEERIKYIKEGISEYITWEQKVYDKMTSLLSELYEQEHYDDYTFLKEYQDKVVIELAHIRDLKNYLEEKNYSLENEAGIYCKIN